MAEAQVRKPSRVERSARVPLTAVPPALVTASRLMLSLGDDFTLDANLATRRGVLLGQPDAGKSNGLAVIAEELLKLNVPVVILDWKGDLWGLRSSADGESEGFPIAVFGGDHGDVTIDEHDGRAIGQVVADERMPAIIDLSAFLTDNARRRFATGFLRSFFAAKRANVAPHPLLIDEYQQFAPETPYKGERDLLAATEQVVGLGRKRGIGVIGTSLRAASLNKNIVELSDILCFMQVAGKNDLVAIDETIRRVASSDERSKLLTEMPQLHRGEVVVYSPSWLRMLEKHRFRLRSTFDSSRTPEVGVDVNAHEPNVFAMPDLAALQARVEATREKRELEDPDALRRRIMELEKQLGQRSKASVPIEKVVEVAIEVEKRVEVPVLAPGELSELASGMAAIATAFDRIGASLERAPKNGPQTALEAPAQSSVPKGEGAPATAPQSPLTARSRRGAAGGASNHTKSSKATSRTAGRAAVAGGKATLKAGAIRILDELARCGGKLFKHELSTVANVNLRNGTLGAYLRELRDAGYVTDTSREVTILGPGLQRIGLSSPRTAPPSTDDLVALYAPKLKAGERRLLDVVR